MRTREAVTLDLALTVMREWAVALDRAPARADGAGLTTSAWRALGRDAWPIVDRFERDGRAYVVAAIALDARTLTGREREVLMAIADGHLHITIAARMGVSPASVATWIGRVRRKTGAQTHGDLVQLGRALRQI